MIDDALPRVPSPSGPLAPLTPQPAPALPGLPEDVAPGMARDASTSFGGERPLPEAQALTGPLDLDGPAQVRQFFDGLRRDAAALQGIPLETRAPDGDAPAGFGGLFASARTLPVPRAFGSRVPRPAPIEPLPPGLSPGTLSSDETFTTAIARRRR